jgi:uncharacterized protein YndB with AHSA1/START domain
MTGSQGPQDAVVIERSFDVPVGLVWQMWTEPTHFRAWYGPSGAVVPVVELDVRVGGARRVCLEMHTPNGPLRMWFVGEFREVLENARLVYTDSMADEAGNVLSPSELGMPQGHPVTTEVRVELEDLDGRTKMVLTHTGVPADSPGAAGWTTALDKLAAHLTGDISR